MADVAISAGASGAATLAVAPEDIAAILSLHPIFARFDPDSLLAVAGECSFATYAADATIMREGDPGTFALVILDGDVDVFVALPAGHVHMATIGRNRVIGELGVFTDMPRTATVIARTPLVVLRLEQASLMQLTTQFPAIGIAIIRELGSRLADMNRSLAYLTYAAEALRRDEYDAAVLEELIGQPGELAIFAQAFAGMADEIRAKQQRREEMQAAAEIQQSILPPPLRDGPAAAAIDLHAEMHPSREVGGDFYDYFMIDENRLALTVADVSGKGIPASLFMAVSRTVMRSMTSAHDMAFGLAEANRLLATQNSACMFVTMFHAVLDIGTGALRYCNAGHNAPYLLRALGGHETLGTTGIPLGIDPDWPYPVATTMLHRGDALFLFSDGITEAFNAAGKEFGKARLEAAIDSRRGGSAAELVDAVLGATNAFAADTDQSDDMTCLALVYQPRRNT